MLQRPRGPALPKAYWQICKECGEFTLGKNAYCQQKANTISFYLGSTQNLISDLHSHQSTHSMNTSDGF